jgi:hypothetical protein
MPRTQAENRQVDLCDPGSSFLVDTGSPLACQGRSSLHRMRTLDGDQRRQVARIRANVRVASAEEPFPHWPQP